MRIKHQCVCDQHDEMPNTLDDIRARCEDANAILRTCDRLIKLKHSRTYLAQCRVCGTLWCVEFPFGQTHGGATCPYAVPTPKHAKPDRLHKIRQEAEDLAWFHTLGPETGPQICGCLNCDRLRIKKSKYCTVHHFRKVKGYRVPGT
jgi:hypothetical protein